MGRGTAMLERPTTAALTTRVAVLMPAYNPGPFINRSVESLVKNTHACDIYIVDDGSKIPVTQILDDFPRTTVIRLEQNGGVVHARNIGLRAILTKGYEFVACLDADDISYPDRIAKQVEFLDSHPEIAVVGAWARFVEEASGKLVFIGRMPESPELVKKTMNYNTAVINSSSMIRTSALKAVGFYSERYPVAEDYELFRRIAQTVSHCEFANYPRRYASVARRIVADPPAPPALRSIENSTEVLPALGNKCVDGLDPNSGAVPHPKGFSDKVQILQIRGVMRPKSTVDGGATISQAVE